tara:strand:+ start:629 stop:1018 length:390 start_codon:yes stop_codon:yes gene_type:complete
MNDFIKKMAELFTQLNEAEGMGALVEINEIELAYKNHVSELKKLHIASVVDRLPEDTVIRDNAREMDEKEFDSRLLAKYSVENMIDFGNFIRDNYHGVGAPKLISYNHTKYPHGTIEDIFVIWCCDNGY